MAMPGRVLIIASSRSAEACRASLGLIEPPPAILGVIADCRPPKGLAKLASLEELDAARLRRFKGQIDSAVLSLPADHRQIRTQILALLREAEIPTIEMPAIEDLLASATVPEQARTADARARSVDLASLIQRDPHEIDHEAVGELLRAKRVVVTGAGGSIGSELAHACCAFEPELIVLMERSENALFEIDRQIQRRYPAIARRAVLHDVTDEPATRRLLREIRPHAIYHAAAHKHVPLMEEHPADAVRNNVFGTRSIADASLEAGVERFVLISSDKAVRPSSIMGATKRLAELYVQSMQDQAITHARDTRFSMVRFGNVLGSAGSVIPIWNAQLAEGGPITVTDSRMTRYFMTIPEAAMLVLQASALSCEGPAPVYVLDMGEPVRILELAKRFIDAHGFAPWISPPGSTIQALSAEAPDGSIPIVTTGIRPGEKLHEALAYDSEHLSPTAHSAINAWAGECPRIDADTMIADLRAASGLGNRSIILSAIRRHVPLATPQPVLKAG